MRKSKLLALILAVSMIFTMVSMVPAVNAEGETSETVTEINVAQNQIYSLPETIDEKAVTWSPAVVDTSKVGYKLCTGTFEDSTQVTYKVNVGEFSSLKVTEDFENYTGEEATPDDGYESFSRGNSSLTLYQKSGVQDDVGIAVLDGNKVYKTGKNYTGWTSRLQELKNLTNGEPYKFTFMHKIVMEENPANADNIMGRIRVQDYDTTGDIFAELYLYTNEALSEIYVKPANSQLTDAPSVSGTKVKVADIDAETKATEWMQFEFEFYADSTFSLKVDDTQVVSGIGNYNEAISSEARPAAISSQNYLANGTQYGYNTYYFDDIKVYGASYITDTIENVTVSATVAQDSAAEQTATVALNMSDGTTKDFTVSYSADTSSAGSKTATGTIDGIDGTIPVSYKVTGIENKTLNTYIGADISSKIPNADTSVFGRRYYSVSGEDIVTNYTVNTGEWGLKVSDNMSSHESSTYTKADGETSYETINAVSADGFKLLVTNSDSDSSSAVLAKDPDDSTNTVVKLTDKVHADNLRWYLGDTFSGSFKVKMRLRFSDFTYTKDSYTLRIILKNSENKDISQSFVRLLADSSGNATGEYALADYAPDGKVDSTSAGNVELIDGKYDTGWIDLEIVGNQETKTIDTYLNGKHMHSDYALKDSTATLCDLSCINVSRRYSNAKNDSVVYVDDVEVYTHKLFTGNLPEGEEVLLGQNVASLSTDIDLTLSDESIKNLPMTLEGVDSSKLGTVSAKGVIGGFDDEVNVNVKVCNYDVVSIGYGNGSEYVSAPVGGGSVKEATFKNVGDKENAKAVFAWFDAQHKLYDAKIADISGIEKGSTEKINVGLSLPADLAGGYLKVFVLNMVNELMPLDLTHIEKDVQAVAPTVFMTGDSTVCNYEDYRFPENGLGQKIGSFLNNGAEVVNLARSGATTTSFIENGLWDSVIKQAKAGDYIFVSFGHNDQGDVTAADYKANLIKFINDAQAKSANVVMFTPIARRTEGQQGIAYDRFNGILDDEEYKGHLDDMKQVCKDYDIPFVDMTTIASTYLQNITDAESIKHYMCDIYYSWDSVYQDIREWSEDDSFSDATYRSGQYGMKDNTHFTQYGAAIWAQMLLKNLKSSYPSINLNNYMTNLDSAINYPLGTVAQ